MPGLLRALVAIASVAALQSLPPVLTDAQLASLMAQVSEPGGSFLTETLLSNELHTSRMIRGIRRAGGAYVGVGPEQNFSYIARLGPDIAWIVDIRPENRALHLMYKMLFGLAEDRGAFVSLLFSRPRPPDATADRTVEGLFDAYDKIAPSDSLRERTLVTLRGRLTSRGLAVSPEDLKWVEYAHGRFAAEGPAIRYSTQSANDETNPTYRALMTARDDIGEPRSFLASEAAYRIVKDLHARNLIVPVVGDFAGPRAIREIGNYLRAHGVGVSVFYASNVFGYLTGAQRQIFCRNLAALPHDEQTRYIGGPIPPMGGNRSFAAEVRACLAAR